LAAADGADALVVIAGFRQSEVATAPLIRDLARMGPRFAALGGIDAGPWVLARAGLLAGHRATVHWEDLEDLGAAHPAVDVVPDRWVIDGNRFTGDITPALLDLVDRGIVRIIDLAVVSKTADGDALILASLAADTRPLGTVLAGLPKRVPGIRIAIGPEGDFTAEEERILRSAGALAVDLGPRILRAETAAIAALAIASEHTRR
jgi:putative intracellular protease/amidase